MHIVLANRLLDRPGGEQLQFFRLARILQDGGHRVTVTTAYDDPERCYPHLREGLDIRAAEHGARVRKPREPGWTGRALGRLEDERQSARDAKRWAALIPADAELVNWHGGSPQGPWLAARRAGCTAPWVWMCNDLPAPIYELAARSRERTVGAERAARFLLPRVPLALDAWARSRLPPGPITVLDETNRWWWRHALQREAVRVSWGLDYDDYHAPIRRRAPDEPLWLLAAGIVSPYRRFEVTIRAVAAARARGVDARLRLCGSLRNEAYVGELRALIGSLGVSDAVDLLGYVPSDDFKRIRESSHALCLTTMGQTWGQITTECAAAGVPSIINETATTLELLHHGRSCWVVDSGSPDSMADAFVTLAGDEDLRIGLATAAQQTARLLSWERYAQEMEEVFLRTLAGVYAPPLGRTPHARRSAPP